MIHRLLVSAILLSLLSAPSFAEEEDDLVRLPGQGEVKADKVKEVGAERLAPGGGLMTTFDADGNGRVSAVELDDGIRNAFKSADKNEDGELTPLEQQDWASNLPTRDESLLNPARFDPNLDRIVSVDEFGDVVRSMAAGYTEEGSNEVVLASLKRKSKRENSKDQEARTPFPETNRNRQARF